MHRLIIRNLRRRKVQVVSMTLSIAMSVMAFVALFLLYGGMSQGIALSEERSGAQLLVIPEDAENSLEESDFLFTGAPVSAYMDASIADDIEQVEGVKRVTVQFYGQTLAESCCSTSGSTRIIGFDPETDWVIAPYCETDISDGLASDEVVVGCNITGFEDGSGQILGNDVRVASVLAPTGTYLDNSVLMPIGRIRELSAANEQFAHYWEKYGDPYDIVSAVLVETDDGDQEAVAGRIKRKVDGDFEVVVRSDVIAQSQESLAASFATMLVAAVLLALASLLQLVARFYSLVWDRKAELALYRALGARTSTLRASISGEALAITLGGCVVGIVAGMVLFAVMLNWLQGVSAFPFQALGFGESLLGIIVIAAIFVAMAAVAVVVPLRQVRKIDPALAMQQLDIG